MNQVRFLLRVVCVPILFGTVWGVGEEPPPVVFPARENFRPTFDRWNTSPELPGPLFRLTVSPADLPRPLLKYRLHIDATDLESGNAAPLYSAAHAEFYDWFRRAMDRVTRSDEYGAAKWPEKFPPPDAMPPTDEHAVEKLKFKAFPLPPHWNPSAYTEIFAEDESLLYSNLDNVFRLMERASRKRDCDWGYILERKGIATMLEHLQQMRELGRYLRGKADWEIRNGNYADAVQTLRVGLRLADQVQVSDFPCLVTGLIGLAIEGLMNDKLRLLAAQPDAPNLYPALTQRIRRNDVLSLALQMELNWLIPEDGGRRFLDRIDTLSTDEANLILSQFLKEMQNGDLLGPIPGLTPTNLRTIFAAVCYPYAVERLRRYGKTDGEIDALSTSQIVVPYLFEELQAAYDAMIVGAMVPPGGTATAIFDNDFNHVIDQFTDPPVRWILNFIFPAYGAAKGAFARTELFSNLEKIVEAIRYYAFVHGKLPERLDDLTELVVPTVNPMTNQAISYRVEGNTAILDFEVPPSGKSRMEITVAF